MIPSRIRGFLIHLLQKQLLRHNRLASYPHFKWLNSSFKWLNICQASETWDYVTTQCSPLTLAILTTSPLHFFSSNNEKKPSQATVQPHHKISIVQERNFFLNHPWLWAHTQSPISSFFLCSLLCMAQATCILTLRIKKKKKKQAFSNSHIARQVLQGDGRKGTTPEAKMQVPAAYPQQGKKKKIPFLQTIWAGAYLMLGKPLKVPLSCHTSLKSLGWQLLHNLHGQPAPSPISTIQKLSWEAGGAF